MRESRIIDQFGVESEYGIRSFNIYEGDIFDKGTELSLQEKPLLVLSTHSSKHSAPAGAVLEKLQEQLGRSLNLDKSPLLSWRGISVFFEETEDFDFKGVLTLRIPMTNIEALSSSVSLFEEVLDVYIFTHSSRKPWIFF